MFDDIDGFSWMGSIGSEDFDVIIGVDILSQCELSLSRSGTCRLAFG